MAESFEGSSSPPSLIPNLRVVKLTPIALSFCCSCKMEFTSKAPVEDEAEAEMKKAFDTHRCEL